MKISIVTPSYNQATFLERTIESVWHQQGDFDLEHIIADGGSNDNSVEIIKKYARLYQNKAYPWQCKNFSCIWWSKPDDGQADALNKGFALCSGQIFGWLNSDDTFCNPYALQVIHDSFKASAADIIVGCANHIDAYDNYLGKCEFVELKAGYVDKAQLKPILQSAFITQPAAFFTKELFLKFRLDKKLHYYMDWDFWIRAFLADHKFYKIGDAIANARLQPNAKTVIAGSRMYREKLKIYRRYRTWGLNRIYCYLFDLNTRCQRDPVLGKISSRLIGWLGSIKKVMFKNSLPVG